VTQNQTEDWKLGSKGCYDAASLAKLQCKLELDFPSVAEVRTVVTLIITLAGVLAALSGDNACYDAELLDNTDAAAPKTATHFGRRDAAKLARRSMHRCLVPASAVLSGICCSKLAVRRDADQSTASVSQGNLRGCVSKPLFPEVADVLTRETLKADPGALSRLMADHTQVGPPMTAPLSAHSVTLNMTCEDSIMHLS